MIERAIELLSQASRILIFTGAGISTASGIPDFRGPDGVWTRIDPSEFTYERYVTDPEVRKKAWAMRRGTALMGAAPNPAHDSIVGLWSNGLVAACVTQNIDGLHQEAGLPSDVVIELHGNAHTSRCIGCLRTWPTTEIMERVTAGEADPACEHCGSIIKTAVVSFGEQMPPTEMERAWDAADRCDAVIAAGSTLSVYPAAEVPLRAAQRSIPYVVINQGATGHDEIADVRIEGDVTEVLPAIETALTRERPPA